MQDTSTQPSSIQGWLLAAFVLVLVLKLFLATQLDLYSDEIFYWWASTRLALAYSDLPFMTALLAGLGSGFGPSEAFAVRSLFLLLGTSLPLLIYWLARPISNHQQALESAALTLCLPLAGFMGLLAVPDVPLVVFGILSIGFFQRALNSDRLVFWIATGCAVALGLSTHYRFFLYPLAALVFLALFTPEQRQWRNAKFWLTVAIASLGLIPILWFNLSNQLSSASFYLVERHPWEFQPSGLLHLFKQAGLVTPPLYFVFVLTLIALYKRARQQDRDSALLLAFASINLAVYWVLAPWTDANSTSIHWPLSGYFPLLVAVPASLRSVSGWCAARWGEAKARRLVLAIPAIGFTGTLVAFIGIGSQAFQTQLQPLVGTGVLSDKMAGWEEFATFTTSIAENNFSDRNPLIITDNYYTAAQVEFAGITTNAVSVDRDKAVRDGRITQLRLWSKDESGLAAYMGYPALYINE
ncbi:MAG: glycosyltransferase family 39 protein, partial [Pseudomonadales bacterium]|nr:glycosyltransferase family 39 protein [Pseudomonadales bacterium]